MDRRGIKKKPNKIIRRIKVAKKKARKLTRPKISLWLDTNLKTHPFILGIFCFIWFSVISRLFFYNKTAVDLIKFHIKFHIILILCWLILVAISNSLRDTQKIRWYFKKRFVFIMLFLFAPLGLVLLWVGSRFKRITKIIYTVIFVSFFIFNSISNEKKYKTLVNTAPFEKITQMIQKQKYKVFLSRSPAQILKNIGFARIPEKRRLKLAVSDIYARYSQGIVSITVKNKDGNEMGEGSGFVLSPEGLIVTNFHVISKAYSAVVKVGEGSTYQASLVKAEPRFDIAVLKINTKGLLPLAIGNSDEVLSGQVVVAIGSPMGFEQSVSSGIVSAVRPGSSMKLIQITAPVSPGSSGGPLLNEYGEVIGITTIASFFMAQNLNFAIPINYLKKVLSQE